jgi:hypothetical protein
LAGRSCGTFGSGPTDASSSAPGRFYERHGFELVSPERKDALLKEYWTIPERQIETSVVLADPSFGD